MVVTVLQLTPSTASLTLNGRTTVTASAVDGSGTTVPVPNGTQVRVADPTVASAVRVDDTVTITALALGATTVQLTKGNVQSNMVIVVVTDVPATITITLR